MISDLYVFRALGDDGMHTLRLKGIYPKGWLKPRKVVAATRSGGWYRLLFLCGTNLYHYDRPRSEYPTDVVNIWYAHNPGCLSEAHPSDVARDLLEVGEIDEVILDENERIIKTLERGGHDVEEGRGSA